MRHGDTRHKLGRPAAHRKSLMANLACSLIEHGRIRTTVAKAKALRPYAEKLVTLGKKGTLHHKGLALSKLRQRAMVKRLFEVIAPLSATRAGGYCRIVKLGPRLGDAAQMAFIEWVDRPAVEVKDEVIVDPDAAKAEQKKQAEGGDGRKG